jgi:hypothetical protein
MNLPFGTGIGGMTVAVKSALITNANTVLVVSFACAPIRSISGWSLYLHFYGYKNDTRPLKPRRRGTLQIIFRKIPVRLVAEQWITIKLMVA